MLESGSTYTENFRYLIHKMIQQMGNGYPPPSRWQELHSFASDSRNESTNQGLFTCVIVVGYGASILVFFGELLIAKFK